MHETPSFVYKLDTGKDGTTLAFVSVETRRFLSHDEVAAIEGVPELFALASAPGMKRGLFRQTRGTPMNGMGALVDAGFSAFEDIDRLESLRHEAHQEVLAKKFYETIGSMADRLHEIYVKSGAYRLPTPVHVARACMRAQEYKRRERLMVEKHEAAMAAQSGA